MTGFYESNDFRLRSEVPLNLRWAAAILDGLVEGIGGCFRKNRPEMLCEICPWLSLNGVTSQGIGLQSADGLDVLGSSMSVPVFGVRDIETSLRPSRDQSDGMPRPCSRISSVVRKVRNDKWSLLPVTDSRSGSGITFILSLCALQIRSQEKRKSAEKSEARNWLRRGSRSMDAALLPRLSFGCSGAIQGHRVGERPTLFCDFRKSGRMPRVNTTT